MLCLRTFGGLELVADGDDLAGAALQPRRLAVLAALAVAGPNGLSRDKLLGLLWPETSEARGRQALSQALYALRRDTKTNDLVLGAEQLRLNSAVITSDVGQLEAADTAIADMLHAAPTLEAYSLAARLLTSFGKVRQANAVRAEARRVFTP